MLVTLMCAMGIAIIVSMWPETYRTFSRWSEYPVSVFACPDRDVLTFNRVVKVRAIGILVLSIVGIPSLAVVLLSR